MAVMVRSELTQLIRRQSDARELVSSIADAMGAVVAIEDSDGTVLHGGPLPVNGVSRFPVRLADAKIGYVAGPERARAVALVLEHLLARSAEQKALGSEVLHLYREINLIYTFSEKLAALLDLDRVAHLTLQQARSLIVATDGAIMLLDEQTGDLSTIASFGDEITTLTGCRRGMGIVGAIAASSIGEIVNDVDSDPRRVTEQMSLKALICAPLKLGEKVIGLIALGSTMPMAYTAGELKLLNTLALQTATAIENARLFERTIHAAQERERLMALHKEAEVARAKLESEMLLAARIQKDLFPAVLPRREGYELAARNRPARRCGGDYYDVLRLTGADGDERLLLCVADVAGKGLPASLVMSNMQATLRALLSGFRSLPALASHASDLLYNTTSAEKYVTAALAELAPATGAVRFVGAGHLDNVIVRFDGSVERLSSTGVPLGLLPAGLPYGQADQMLHPGDALVLFSDGVTDAQDGTDEEFGEARLLDVMASVAGQPAETVIDRVFAAIDAFAGGAPQFDDMTILVARRL